MFEVKVLASPAREFRHILKASLEGQRPGDQPGAFWVRLLEERIYGLGGSATRLRLQLFRDEELVWSLVYDDIFDPASVAVYRQDFSEEAVGYILLEGTPEERHSSLRRIFQALQAFWTRTR